MPDPQSHTTPNDQRERLPADYTEGSITRAIIMMGAPSMFGFVASHIYTMMDTWWVAKLPASESAVAALVIFNNIMWFIGSINMMIGSGSVAMISRRYGEKRFDLAEQTIKETFFMKFVVGLVFAAVGLAYLPELVALVGARGETHTLALLYGEVMLYGLPLMFVSYSVWTAMRSIANPHMAMALMFSSTALNMALDPLLIFGYFGFPEWGIKGAAIASVISYGMVFVVGNLLLMSGRANVRLKPFTGAKLRLSSMWAMLKIGAPAWVAGASDSGMRLAITPVIAMYGDDIIASYGIGVQVVGLGIMIVVGAGLGLSSLIGQTLGAGKVVRAKNTATRALQLAIGVMSVVGLVVYLFAPDIARLYFDDPNTIAHTVTALRVFAFGFPFWGLWILLESLYSGVGMNKPTMVASVIHAWILQVPMAYVIVNYFNSPPNHVWLSLTAIAALTGMGFYLYYRKGTWLEARV